MISDIKSRANNYYYPYLYFSFHFVEKVVETKEAKLKKLSDPVEIGALREEIERSKGDVLTFLQHCVNNFDDKNTINCVYRESIIDLVFSMYNISKPSLVIVCQTIIGQLIALGDDDFSIEFIKKKNILNKINQILG